MVEEDGSLGWSQVYLFPHFIQQGGFSFVRLTTAAGSVVRGPSRCGCGNHPLIDVLHTLVRAFDRLRLLPERLWEASVTGLAHLSSRTGEQPTPWSAAGVRFEGGAPSLPALRAADHAVCGPLRVRVPVGGGALLAAPRCGRRRRGPGRPPVGGGRRRRRHDRAARR